MHAPRAAALALALVASTVQATWAATAPSSTTQARAQRSGLSMPLTSVDVDIVDGVATTTLSQTIRNHDGRQAEAEWLLPLPADAVVDGFEMTVAGVVQESQVLDADQARRVYERIVRQRRDPGLLRYAGRGLLRANVFPIPPRDDVIVKVTYRQVLPDLGGMSRWTFPATGTGLPGQIPDSLVLDLEITSTQQSLGNALSPNPALHVVRLDDRHAKASFEGPPVGLDELEVLYGLQSSDFGLDLLTHMEEGQDEGSFVLLVSPRAEWDDLKLPAKRITFAIDTSGSMTGTKLEQARAALLRFLGSLGPEDRFDVVTFSTSADALFGRPVAATDKNVERARTLATELEAAGGTNTEAALREVLDSPQDADRVSLVVLLTDGRPTIGETRTEPLLASVRAWNEAGSRIFVLGVGHNVNAPLLDSLAMETGATRDYVREGEDIDAVAGALFTQLSHPVMTDLELTLDGPRTTRVAPARLPDLFLGQRLSVVGRYEGARPMRVRLSGRVSGERRTYVLDREVATAPDARFDFVPLLWAERRVAVLLDAMRLNPDQDQTELRDEVVRLGTRYGIVTPYTSHLILEEGMQLAGGGPVGGAGGGGAATGPRTPGSPAGPPSPASPGAPRGHGGTYRGPGSTVPPSPAAPAPATPGTRAPGPGGARTPTTGSGDWYLGRPEDTRDFLVERLRALGVLPSHATDEELAAMAERIAKELRASADALRGLGGEESGKRAVDDSAYLAKLISSTEVTARRGLSRDAGRDAATKALLELFRRRAGGRVLNLRAGTWTDAAYDAELHGDPVEVEAFGDAYFALAVAHPDLAEVLAVSDRLLVVVDGVAYRIEPAEVAEAPSPDGARR